MATTPRLTIWFGSHPLMFAPQAGFEERGATPPVPEEEDIAGAAASARSSPRGEAPLR